MKMNRRCYTVLGLALVPLLAACGNGGESGEETYDLSFATYNVPGAAESLAQEEWASQIEEATDGRVSIEFFYQEALLGGDETLQGVNDGRADMGWIAGAYYPAELPLSNVVGVPFVTDDPMAQGRALVDLYQNNDEFRNEWQSQGVHVLSWAPVPANIVAMSEEISSFEDLESQQIRGYGYVSEALELAGVNAMGIAQGEVYEALQRGVLDGTSGASLNIAVDRDFHEVAPYFVDIGYGNYATTANIINLDTWESMPEDIRQAIEEVSADFLDVYEEELTALEEESCDVVLDAGAEVAVIDETETQEWRDEAGPAIRDLWAEDVAATWPEVDADAFFEEYESSLTTHAEESEYTPAVQACADRG